MPIIIRCQSCPVLSVGGTGAEAIERFDAHELEFHDANKPAKQGATEKVGSPFGEALPWAKGGAE